VTVIERIRLVGLSREFGDARAVDNVDLAVHDGEFFSLIGPSGCGKTTTLRMIAGLEEPTSGRILLGGHDITGVPAYRRPVNTVFQQYALFPHLDVFENVAFGLRERRDKRDSIERDVRDMLELVGLSEREHAKPRELSGGQQQRVALGRALVMRPEVLLLDEPLGALDLKLRRQMQLALKQIQHRVGIAFLFVTHDQEEAFAMSDRVGVMNGGVIEQVGPPREIYRRPATLFVAKFVGASNCLDATVRRARGAGRYTVALKITGRVFDVSGVPGLAERDAAVVVVRPETIVTGPAAGEGVELSGRLLDIAFLGSQVVTKIDVPGAGELTAAAPGDDPATEAADSETLLSFDPGTAWVLAADPVGRVERPSAPTSASPPTRAPLPH
jgi:spermidine/putrescine transport system ATP-binding protein